LFDLEKQLKKKAEWRNVGEHSAPRERHGVYRKGQRVWNWIFQEPSMYWQIVCLVSTIQSTQSGNYCK
jgi:hypothetical protein